MITGHARFLYEDGSMVVIQAMASLKDLRRRGEMPCEVNLNCHASTQPERSRLATWKQQARNVVSMGNATWTIPTEYRAGTNQPPEPEEREYGL